MYMVEQEYLRKLFSFQAVVKQSPDNTGAGRFLMEPTEEGAKTLSSYGLHFKPKENGFVVVAPCIPQAGSGLLELKTQFAGGAKLSFAVFCNDPHFFDYAELPYDPPGEYVYYINNLNENDPGTQLLFLNNRGLTPDQRVMLHTKQFTFPIVRDGQNKIVLPWVLDCRGNIIPETRYDPAIDERRNTYSLDLSRLPDGLYTIQNRITGSTRYYCTKASFIRRIPLVILEIFADPNLPEKCRIVQAINGVQYLNLNNFTVHIGNYSYFWKYIIRPVNIFSSVWVKAKTGNSAYPFTPEKIKITGQESPAVFTSGQAIDTPNNELNVMLYRMNWNGDCRLATQKYKYCNQDYGIQINNDFWCLYKDSDGIYKYKCPARSTDELIGVLPKPGEAATRYYKEAGQQFAEITLFLVKECDRLVIKNKI
jgi:hypothetical protein